MDAAQTNQAVEIRLTYRYIKAHPWTVQAISGFLSAYFMEKPGFTVQRHLKSWNPACMCGSVKFPPT